MRNVLQAVLMAVLFAGVCRPVSGQQHWLVTDELAVPFPADNISASGDAACTGGWHDVRPYRWNGAFWSQAPGLITYSNLPAANLVSLGEMGEGLLVTVATGGGSPDQNFGWIYEWAGSAWTEGHAFSFLDGTFGVGAGRHPVAVGEQMVLLGTPWDEAPFSEPGKVRYLLRGAAGWTEPVLLQHPSPMGLDYFGIDLGVSGGRAIVGAPKHSSGIAYIFRREGEGLEVETALLAPYPWASTEFGAAVAIDGDRVLVGEPGMNIGTVYDAGTAYLFERIGGVWQQRHQFFASAPQANARFGAAVALQGDAVAIGAPRDDSPGAQDRGAVYIFRFDGKGWSEEARLAPDIVPPSGKLGTAVAITGAHVLVGAPGSPGSAPDDRIIAFRHTSQVCYADCNADGVASVADFGCFQTKFVTQHPYADCNHDGYFWVPDFACFQTSFVGACP